MIKAMDQNDKNKRNNENLNQEDSGNLNNPNSANPDSANQNNANPNSANPNGVDIDNSNNRENGNPKKKKLLGESRPAVAIIGFFVGMFLFALLAYLFQAMWITGVGAAVCIAWAIIFAIDWDKEE